MRRGDRAESLGKPEVTDCNTEEQMATKKRTPEIYQRPLLFTHKSFDQFVCVTQAGENIAQKN